MSERVSRLNWVHEGPTHPAPMELIAPYDQVTALNPDILDEWGRPPLDSIVDYDGYRYRVVQSCRCRNKIWLRWPD